MINTTLKTFLPIEFGDTDKGSIHNQLCSVLNADIVNADQEFIHLTFFDVPISKLNSLIVDTSLYSLKWNELYKADQEILGTDMELEKEGHDSFDLTITFKYVTKY